MKRYLGCTLILMLAGCAMTPPTAVHQPMTARPQPPVQMVSNNGSIYQVSLSRPLFEDRRARMVGDTLTINIVEKTAATKASSSSAERDMAMEVTVPTLSNLPFKRAQGVNIDATNETTFSGKGGAAANNAFTGTMTVTVIEVLANGNLLVSGEKMLSINQGDEFIRFSGVVDPVHITSGNVVSSTQVADARIEYKQNGFIDSAEAMGWLGRFFLSFLPF